MLKGLTSFCVVVALAAPSVSAYAGGRPSFGGGGGFRPAPVIQNNGGGFRPAPVIQNNGGGFRPGPVVQNYGGGGFRPAPVVPNYRGGFPNPGVGVYRPGPIVRTGPYGVRPSYRPWAAPIAYNWGWGAAPWRAYYGAYFQPYPTYFGPSYWLTDYVLADLLAQEYAMAAANQGGVVVDDNSTNPVTVIDDATKDQIRAQVENDLRNQENQQPPAPDAALTDLNHIFVVSQDLNAVDSNSAACALTSGDLIRLTAVPAQGDPAASVVVQTSKRGSCPAGSQISISIQDLQAMENDFSAKVASGVTEMNTVLPNQADQTPAQQ